MSRRNAKFDYTDAEKKEIADFKKYAWAITAIGSRAEKEVQALIDEGVNVNARDLRRPGDGYRSNGYTPLAIAYRDRWYPELVTMLLDAGADPNIKVGVGVKSMRENLTEDLERERKKGPLSLEWKRWELILDRINKPKQMVALDLSVQKSLGKKLPTDVMKNIASYGGSKARRSRKTKRRKTLRRK